MEDYGIEVNEDIANRKAKRYSGNNRRIKVKTGDVKRRTEEMENIEVLKEYRSIDISIDKFL